MICFSCGARRTDISSLPKETSYYAIMKLQFNVLGSGSVPLALNVGPGGGRIWLVDSYPARPPASHPQKIPLKPRRLDIEARVCGHPGIKCYPLPYHPILSSLINHSVIPGMMFLRCRSQVAAGSVSQPINTPGMFPTRRVTMLDGYPPTKNGPQLRGVENRNLSRLHLAVSSRWRCSLPPSGQFGKQLGIAEYFSGLAQRWHDDTGVSVRACRGIIAAFRLGFATGQTHDQAK